MHISSLRGSISLIDVAVDSARKWHSCREYHEVVQLQLLSMLLVHINPDAMRSSTDLRFNRTVDTIVAIVQDLTWVASLGTISRKGKCVRRDSANAEQEDFDTR